MKDEESSIVYLLKKLRDDTTALVRDEISLAKTEISEKIAITSRNVGYLAAGALVAYAALILILQGFSFLLGGLFIYVGDERGQCESARFSYRWGRCRRDWRHPDCQGPGHAEKRTSYSNQNRRDPQRR